MPPIKLRKIAIYNLAWMHDLTDEDGWCLMTEEGNAFGIMALITAPDTFHNTILHLMRLTK